MTDGHVDTPYGRMPGCPVCGVIPLRGALLCEHGVTSAPTFELSATVEIRDPDFYRRLPFGDVDGER